MLTFKLVLKEKFTLCVIYIKNSFCIRLKKQINGDASAFRINTIKTDQMHDQNINNTNFAYKHIL